MAKKIFEEYQGESIRIGGVCYAFIGETIAPINTDPSEVQGAYASCLECEVIKNNV